MLAVCFNNAREMPREEQNLLHELARDVAMTHRLLLAEAVVESSERKLRSLFEASNNGIIVLDPRTGSYVDCNHTAEVMTGYGREEILTMGPGRLWPEDEMDVVESSRKRVLKGESVMMEGHILTRDGRKLPVEVTERLVDAGDERYVMKVIRDMSAGNEAREVLEHANAMLNLAQKAGGVCAWEMYPNEGRIVAGDDLRELVGHPPGALSEDLSDWMAIVPGEDLANVRSAIKDLMEGRTESYDVEHRVVRADGLTTWIKETGMKAPVPEGASGKIVGISRDISWRKGVESEMEEAVMYSVGLLDLNGQSLVVLDEDANVMTASDSFLAMLGLARGEVAGKNLFSIRGGLLDHDPLRSVLAVARSGERDVTGPVLELDFVNPGIKKFRVIIKRSVDESAGSRMTIVALEEQDNGIDKRGPSR
jgi:PAS domain S-box-containing protein